MIFVALYVDDLVLASSSDKMLKETKQALSDRFEMTDMGQLKYFLGMEIEQNVVTGDEGRLGILHLETCLRHRRGLERGEGRHLRG
ncbi:unnamed protein product [Phytophthora fragariaefolia]|uniref:Unnamed protein product n=1 Tax=Phytophthora fragariaefolia TaxID=1490495 RepID=A0A9W7DD88_9STRA|nr:unnamed protein product [Phytophthora fragariaefolia]